MSASSCTWAGVLQVTVPLTVTSPVLVNVPVGLTVIPTVSGGASGRFGLNEIATAVPSLKLGKFDTLAAPMMQALMAQSRVVPARLRSRDTIYGTEKPPVESAVVSDAVLRSQSAGP